MTNKQQLIKVARIITGMVRVAGDSRQPDDLVGQALNMLSVLWDVGCHNDRLTADEKETARRIVLVIQGRMQSMFGLPTCYR